MDHPLNIIIIEDDAGVCKRFTACTDSSEGILISAITNSSYDALALVKKHHPDAIILELELNTGAGNGLLFLNHLKTLALPYKPYILVTTNNSSPVTYAYARHAGADFIMYKRQADYSEHNAIAFLQMMKPAILQSHGQTILIDETADTSKQQNLKLKRLIDKELNLIGISPKLTGYRYLSEAIFLLINGHNGSLCGIIAERYQKTDSSVERAMQNAINKAWRSNDMDELSKNYTAKINSERGVPTLTEFVYYYATKIKDNS